MSMLRNVLTYMGLGPDEDYDDGYPYDPSDEDDVDEPTADAPTSGRSGGRRPTPSIDLTDGARHTAPSNKSDRRGGQPAPPPTERRSQGGSSAQRRPPPRQRPTDDERRAEPPARRGRHDLIDTSPSRPLRAVPPAELADGGAGITIRSVPPLPDEPSEPSGPVYVKPHSLSPQSFGDAKTLADQFKSGVPVIMNLQGVQRDLARRLIDFASGICYALDGGMEKIAPQVFLLTPSSVEVSAEERRRLEQRDFRR
jgi:cell division inhibitor SepF